MVGEMTHVGVEDDLHFVGVCGAPRADVGGDREGDRAVEGGEGAGVVGEGTGGLDAGRGL